jgi:hypothetical protein
MWKTSNTRHEDFMKKFDLLLVAKNKNYMQLFEYGYRDAETNKLLLDEKFLDVNSDETLIRYYEHCDIYDGHYDHARFTVASYFYKEPKAFTGGDLHFEDFNYTISIKNNMVVFFVGNAIKHSSTHLIMNNDLPKFNGMGKYSMMQFLNTNKVYSDKNV